MSDLLYRDYKINANFYDIFNKDKPYNIEMHYLLRILKHRREVLDVGCGTGYHLSLLEDLGYLVEGIDINPKMIAVAKMRVKSPIYEANLLDFKLDSKYNAVIAMHHVFNHLKSYEEFEIGVKNLLEHTKKGGIVVIDLDNRRQTGIIEDKVDGNKRIIECKYNKETEIEERKITNYIGARKFETIHEYLIYDPRKLEKILDNMNVKYAMLTNYLSQSFKITDKILQIVIRKI